MIIGFDQEAPRHIVGCKGCNLAMMWKAGLPVPRGFCVTWDGMPSVDELELARALDQLEAASFAVRSSAIEEDSSAASFAGILVSHLNVKSAPGVMAALEEIRTAAMAPAAMGYSRRREVQSALRVAALVQVFVPAEASGVLFMRDPLSGADHIVVEGSWGLGAAVVEGRVHPDRWTLSASGLVMSAQISDKDIAVVPGPREGAAEIAVDPSCRRRPSLSPEILAELLRLASECQRLFGDPQDIEWAVADNRVWLLQSRPITSRV